MQRAIYQIKDGIKKQIKEKIKFKDLAKKVGINSGYISQIMNGRKASKVIAYSITKAVSPDLEIKDLFEEKLK